MTKRLFDDDVMLRSCKATVKSCEPCPEGWQVALDQSIFFPEEGGQLSDRGTIGGVPVLHVSEKNGEILHLCSQPLEIGMEVEAELDWQTRFDHMQQHTGEHILSYSIYHLCGANNVGFHMSEGLVTIDMDRELTEEELVSAEQDANRMIWENHPVKTHLVPDSELDQYPLRKKTEKVKGILRLVEVETGDICTCCGTHVPMTGMVGAIRVIRQARYKGGVRIEFCCGRWALEDAREKNKIVLAAGAELSVKPEGVVAGIQRLKAEKTEAEAQLRAKSTALAAFRAKELLETAQRGENGARLILSVEPDTDQQTAKALLSALTAEPQVTAGLFLIAGTRLQYLFASSGAGNCRTLCQKANQLFNGKGGGSETNAQGSAPLPDDDWKEKISALQTL